MSSKKFSRDTSFLSLGFAPDPALGVLQDPPGIPSCRYLPLPTSSNELIALGRKSWNVFSQRPVDTGGVHECRNYRERVQKEPSGRGAGKRDWESVLPVGEGRVWKE